MKINSVQFRAIVKLSEVTQILLSRLRIQREINAVYLIDIGESGMTESSQVTRPGAFPQTTGGVLKAAHDFGLSDYEEYLYIVNYHLERAFSHASRAERLLSGSPVGAADTPFRLLEGSFAYGLGADRSSIVVFKFPPEGIVWNGDSAVREAVLALDAGLLLTNYVLNLGFPAHKVGWGADFRKVLADRFGGGELVPKQVSRSFDSLEYDLLSSYRNWVTHRGAPKILGSIPEESLRLPAGATSKSDERELNWQIQKFVSGLVSKHARVRCAPFVRPVRSVYRIEGKDFEISRVVKSDGELTAKPEDYRAANPVRLEESLEQVAGSELATYGVFDYLSGVSDVVRYAQVALVGEWDEWLAKVLVTKTPPEQS